MTSNQEHHILKNFRRAFKRIHVFMDFLWFRPTLTNKTSWPLSFFAIVSSETDRKMINDGINWLMFDLVMPMPRFATRLRSTSSSGKIFTTHGTSFAWNLSLCWLQNGVQVAKLDQISRQNVWKITRYKCVIVVTLPHTRSRLIYWFVSWISFSQGSQTECKEIISVQLLSEIIPG